MANPLDQFIIKPIEAFKPIEIAGYDVSFTNSSLYMCLAVISIVLLFAFCLRKKELVPGKAQLFGEGLYAFIKNTVKENAGHKGEKYFPFIFSLFLFVAFGNILGLTPYSFTFTSHLAAVGGLALIGLAFNMIVGIKNRKFGYLRVFMPKGIPWPLAPLIVPIEMISLLSKPFSLTVRLIANMTVGHIMLKIIAGFIVVLGVGGIVPLTFSSLIVIFEIFISLLQAYIFTILSCIYLGDAINEH